MAAKSKDKKEKGKKGKHKAEKVRLDSAAGVMLSPVAESTRTTPGSTIDKKALGSSPTSTGDAILDAVIECVANGGIEGLTTRRIAAQAGVNEVTIFRHFGNKDALLDAVFVREAARMRNGAALYSSNLEADLARIVTHFSEHWMRRMGVLPILLEVSQQRAGEQNAAYEHLASFTDVQVLLERYMKEGKLRREPAQQTLNALIGPLVFGALLGQAAGGSANLDATEHVRAFLYGHAGA